MAISTADKTKIVTDYQRAQGDTDREVAVALFYAVRDRIRYDPYRITFDGNAYHASAVIEAGFGWCIPKAGVLAACARAVGIPSAIGLADVVNHLTTEKLLRKMGGVNVFYDHGYVALQIDGRWVKAVPAFNIELCERFGTKVSDLLAKKTEEWLLGQPARWAPAVYQNDRQAAARGAVVFQSSGCQNCHVTAGLGTGELKRIGTKDLAVPSLRSLAQRGPYRHDGRAADLPAVFSDPSDSAHFIATPSSRDDLSTYLKTGDAP